MDVSSQTKETAKNILLQDPDSMNLEGQIVAKFLFEKYHHEKTKSDYWEKYIKNTIEFLEKFDKELTSPRLKAWVYFYNIF